MLDQCRSRCHLSLRCRSSISSSLCTAPTSACPSAALYTTQNSLSSLARYRGYAARRCACTALWNPAKRAWSMQEAPSEPLPTGTATSFGAPLVPQPVRVRQQPVHACASSRTGPPLLMPPSLGLAKLLPHTHHRHVPGKEEQAPCHAKATTRGRSAFVTSASEWLAGTFWTC